MINPVWRHTELLAWQQQTGNPKTAFLVHAEQDIMQTFARKLEKTHVKMPELGQKYTL